MATNPLTDDNVAGGAAGGEEDMSQGYTIEINVGADGKITVGVEAKSEEDNEESAGSQGDTDPEEANDGATPVSGIKQAIEIVMDIYKNGGQVADSAAADDQFNAGFSGAPAAKGSM